MSIPVFRVNSSQDHEFNAINIELWGFRDCPLVKPRNIAEALQLLPPHQLEGLNKIAYEEHALVPGLTRWVRLPGRSRHRGRYDHSEQSITLHRCSGTEQLYHTLFHELGHFVYFRIISSVEKKQWVTQVYKKERPVTPYGRRNAAEDFAEAYALYVYDPQRLAERNLKYGFMRETVFRDRTVDKTTLALLIEGESANAGASHLDTRI
jgi:hypothetical protein